MIYICVCTYMYIVYCIYRRTLRSEFFSENFYIPLLPLNLRCPHIVQSFPDEIFVSGNRIRFLQSGKSINF